MTYDEAMAAIRNVKVTVTRVTEHGPIRVANRFGHPAILTGGNRHIDFTPTTEDYYAIDWRICRDGERP